MEHILVERTGDFATITMNRPQRRNALSLAHMRELIAAFQQVGDSDAFGIVLAGNGPVFSAGHDFADVAGADLQTTRRLLTTCTELMTLMQQVPQPVVARVHGLATAAGCQLVATADLAVASEDAGFAAPGGKGGWFCHTPMVAIARNVGRKRAMELALSGDVIDARTALDWGLVNAVVPAGQLDDAVQDLLERVTRGSAASKGIGKQALYAQIDLDQPKAYAYAIEVMAATSQLPDAQEGIGAFLNKRKPLWQHGRLYVITAVVHPPLSTTIRTVTTRIAITALAAATLSAATFCAATLPSASAASIQAAGARGAVAFVPIVEPFDPGHPARAAKNPGNCAKKQTTIGLEFCFDTLTENTDVKIDAAQLARFDRSGTAQREAINAQDRAWLAARLKVCEAVYHSGGTIDGINIASCQLDESTARQFAITGKAAPLAKLSQTDNTDLSQLSYYTTPDGTRIATIDTQGDQTGGEVLAWVIVGGYQGFTVNTGQFSYRDGSFTDAGVVQPPNPRGHHVKPGAVYQFSIDYSTISHDPHAAKGTGGYVYAPGGHVLADWAGR